MKHPGSLYCYYFFAGVISGIIDIISDAVYRENTISFFHYHSGRSYCSLPSHWFHDLARHTVGNRLREILLRIQSVPVVVVLGTIPKPLLEFAEGAADLLLINTVVVGAVSYSTGSNGCGRVSIFSILPVIRPLLIYNDLEVIVLSDCRKVVINIPGAVVSLDVDILLARTKESNLHRISRLDFPLGGDLLPGLPVPAALVSVCFGQIDHNTLVS